MGIKATCDYRAELVHRGLARTRHTTVRGELDMPTDPTPADLEEAARAVEERHPGRVERMSIRPRAKSLQAWTVVRT